MSRIASRRAGRWPGPDGRGVVAGDTDGAVKGIQSDRCSLAVWVLGMHKARQMAKKARVPGRRGRGSRERRMNSTPQPAYSAPYPVDLPSPVIDAGPAVRQVPADGRAGRRPAECPRSGAPVSEGDGHGYPMTRMAGLPAARAGACRERACSRRRLPAASPASCRPWVTPNSRGVLRDAGRVYPCPTPGDQP